MGQKLGKGLVYLNDISLYILIMCVWCVSVSVVRTGTEN